MLQKLFRKISVLLLNNIPVNNLLILTGYDHLIKLLLKNWSKINFDKKLSLLENSGFSDLPVIQEVLNKSHQELQHTYRNLLHSQGKVLDVGCGPGLFLKDFEHSKELYGLDMNPEFIEIAKTNLPYVKFILGNYLKTTLNIKFKLIYANGMLMYIERSRLKYFFEKTRDNLEEGGIVFITYSHALMMKDVLYSDLSFIRYSPRLIEKIVSEYFSIIKHEHLYDGRKVGLYDKKHYYFPDGNNNRLDTVQNSYILIARKK